MDANQSFRYLLHKSIYPVLKTYGYIKKGCDFYIRWDDNYGIVNFQKSQKSTSNKVFFTINIGISSALILNFNNNERDRSKIPTIEECHWVKRIGAFMNPQSDFWYTIDDETLLENLFGQIKKQISDLIIPSIQQFITDESLRDYWLAGKFSGDTELQTLTNLSILLKYIGPIELLDKTIAKLKQISKGKPYESTVNCHVEKLKLWKV